MSDLRDQVLAVPRDVEDLASLGRRMGCCPYYGSRGAIATAEVVALPYSMLLSRHTRETLGLKLEGCVVVVDEGHNLVDAINQTHSAQLRLTQVRTSLRTPRPATAGPVVRSVTLVGEN